MMKRLFGMNSLKKKILGLFLLLTIVPLVITVIVMYFTLSTGFDEMVKRQQTDMEHLVESEFNTVSEKLRKLTETYSEREDFAEAFNAGDREALLWLSNEDYDRLVLEHGIEVFEFGDADANVFLRAHNPASYGDNKSEIEAIRRSLEGEAIAGLEFGNSGLSVRAFAPIQYNNEIIGTLQMGMSDAFLEALAEKLKGVTIDLYDDKGVVVESSSSDHIGSTIADKSRLQSVLDGVKSSEFTKGDLRSYIPLADPTGNETIGIIGISQDISIVKEAENEIIWRGLLITALLIILVLVISVSFSNSIADPIRVAAKSMAALSQGNLRFSVKENKRTDEIGELMKSISVVRKNLHDTLAQVAAGSIDVTAKSEEMTQSSYEVKEGSEQISLAMQDIAQGSERQAISAGRLAEAMRSYAANIGETSEKSSEIEKSSRDVLKMTEEGKALMKSSEEQMMKIDEIVQDAVIKMNELDKQSQEISRLVTVINNIAEQTNLLALNAAIEAARAGESGKGFAVVANEVRKLAEQVASSVTEITGFASNIQTESTNVASSLKDGYAEVKQGTREITLTSETFNKINSSVNVMAENIQSIAEKMSEISGGSQEMNSAIEEIAAVSEEAASSVEQAAATAEQSSASMEEIADAAEKLAELSEELNNRVGTFKL